MEKRFPDEGAMCKESSNNGSFGAGSAYTAFLDVLANVCCADSSSGLDTSSAADLTFSGGSGDNNTDLRRPLNSKHGISATTTTSGSSNSATLMDKDPLAESILPHLRFNPLSSATSSTPIDVAHPTSISAPSLDNFFDLFLADEAPHSFLSFHKSKGDEQIKATPWKIGQKDDQLERTITFITKFTPKNLQQPQDSNKNDATATTPTMKTITDISNPTLTLAVTSRQTLCRQPSTMVLESLLSFDFLDSSIHKSSLSKMLNLSLTQFLISNDVKGNEVLVRVILKEGRGGIGSTVSAPMNGEQQVQHPFLLPDRLPSLSEDPLSGIVEGDNDYDYNNNCKGAAGGGCDITPGNQCNNVSPTRVGASILSAIRARNCPTPTNSRCKRTNSPLDEAALLITNHSEDKAVTKKKSSTSSNTKTRDFAAEWSKDGAYDILRSASSRGTPKFKHVSSFENAKKGEMTMRRMLWEKDGSGNASSRNGARRDDTHTSEDETSSSLLTPRDGLSMHIEMEVCNSTSNNNTALLNRTPSSSSSLTRSRSAGVGPSIAYIEEKVRKGLKKRVARSWITWAESWCMRLWEDEQMERFMMNKGSPLPITRKRSNTRPTVRRIGEKKTSSTHVWSVQEKRLSPNDEMKQLVDKHTNNIQTKPKVVTPTSSPNGNNKHINGWTTLKVKNGNQRFRWMSSEEEDHYGVEVCPSLVKTRSGRSSKDPPSSEGRSSPVRFIRGLKSKS